MTDLLQIVTDFFQQDEWPYTPVEGKTALRTKFKGDNGQWDCFAMSREKAEQVIFYSVLPNHTPEDRRPAMAEFITRVNYDMFIGNLEMDFRDGEIRYKTSMDVEGGELTPGMVKQLVYANVMMTDKYFPGIMKVMYGNQSPEEIVKEIEG